MPDTPYSMYSEHDEASKYLEKEYKKWEEEIEYFSRILESMPKGSSEFEIALKSMNHIIGFPSPSTTYAYVDEDGNDMYTTLGGGPYIADLAIKALRKIGLEPSVDAMEKYSKIR